MTYAQTENGAVVEYPVYEGDIRLRYSNVSFATPFTPPQDYELVVEVDSPQIDYTQNLTEDTPERMDGVLMRKWVISKASPQEIQERIENQWNNIRISRNGILSRCDWTQLPDCPLSNLTRNSWADYRQALRDITDQTDPFNIVWPQEPS